LAKDRRAYDSSVYTAKLDGEAIGEARGKAEGQAQVLNLVAKGYSLAQIKKKLRVKSKLRVEN